MRGGNMMEILTAGFKVNRFLLDRGISKEQLSRQTGIDIDKLVKHLKSSE
jgi:hypothetical protein